MVALVLSGIACAGQANPQATSSPELIIDMHQHAIPVDTYGPPPLFICAPYDAWPAWDPQTGGKAYGAQIAVHPPCAKPLKSGMTNDEVMQKTLTISQQYNITAVTNGSLAMIAKWKAAGGDRVLPATYWFPKEGPPLDRPREQVKSKKVMGFAELGQEYIGVPADDPSLEPLYALAEELDVPVGIHMGPGPPGAPYVIDQR